MKDKFWILIIIIALLRFINLGFGDINPWDEAMYAIRSKSIVAFGEWLDQTEYSVGGLYTSSHPPLFIWLTAIGFHLFGISNVTVRLISAIFGALTVIIMYEFCKRLFERRTAIFAATILGLNPLFTHFCRQGQLDITYTFFITFSILSYLYYRQNQKNRWRLIAGISFGLALMSKILVGFFVPMILAPYLLVLIIRNDEKISDAISDLAIIFSIGILIALPWHAFMTIKHGRAFIDYFFLFHLVKRSVAGVEENVRKLGAFYFVNQLLVRMPAALMSGIYAIFRSIRLKKSSQDKRKRIFLLIWFLVVFIVISAFKTKLITYMIPALIPLSILAGITLSQISRSKINRKHTYALLLLTLLNIFWAMNYELRQQAKSLIKSLLQFDFPSLNFLTPVIITILSAFLILFLIQILQKRMPTSNILGISFLIIVFSTLIISCTYYDFMFLPKEYDWGIEKIKEIFYEKDFKRLIAVGKYRNDQIPYYFDGAGIDAWQAEVDYQRIEKWKGAPLSDDSLVIVEKFGFDEDILPYLRMNFCRIMENHRYIVYAAHSRF
jgi:4-amino-4-deoxy-L-arabinose transferase-like glycosyltransferase